MTIMPLSMNRPRSSATDEMALEVCTSEPSRETLVPSPSYLSRHTKLSESPRMPVAGPECVRRKPCSIRPARSAATPMSL